MTDACAAIVRRDDPHLWKTALFAPEPARSRLMVLYAFDCQLSRASTASKESMIPRMRLQWWRDVIAGAAADRPDHEVAAPLVDLIRDRPDEATALAALVDAHEDLLGPPMIEPAFADWSARRFGGRMGLALRLLGQGGDTPPAASRAQGHAFLFRNMARMAAEGRTPLSLLAGPNLATLARGELSDFTREWLRSTAAKAHGQCRALPRRAGRGAPAMMPLEFDARVLASVAQDPRAVFGQLDDVDRPFDGLWLAWRAFRGRW